jgi:hypothetical protein
MLSRSLSLPLDIPISRKETLQEPRRSCFYGPRRLIRALASPIGRGRSRRCGQDAVRSRDREGSARWPPPAKLVRRALKQGRWGGAVPCAAECSPIPPRSARLATNEEEGGVATEQLLSALVPRPHQQADQDRLAQAQRAQREVQAADGDRYPGRDAFSRFEALGAA